VLIGFGAIAASVAAFAAGRRHRQKPDELVAPPPGAPAEPREPAGTPPP
jgi:hypothetical protein